MKFLALLCLVVLTQSAIDARIFEKRIVNGRASVRGQWPWLVSLNMLKAPRSHSQEEAISSIQTRDSHEPTLRRSDEEKRLEMENSIKRFLDQIKAQMATTTSQGNTDIEHLTKIISQKLRSSSRNQQHVPTFEGHMCSGALISDRWILSAKHCFNERTNANLTDDPRRWTAEIGEYSLSGIDGHERSHKISKIIVREPRSGRNMNFNDIALLKVADTVKFTEYVQPIRLSTPDDFYPPGELCTVAGWGHTSSGGEMTDVIHHVEVPLLSKAECTRRSILWMTDAPGPGELCAGGGLEDACQYDSGGPLVCRQGNIYKQVGIVSRGEGCGDGFPGIYTDVRDHLDWIIQVIESE